MKLKHIFLTLAATALFSTAQAQVKVGANPGTIGTNSSLEVEATNGKKVIVNKADGTTTIENIPASTSASDKILGVDATGKVVTLQSTPVSVAPYLKVKGVHYMSSNSPLVSFPATTLGVEMSNQMTYTSGTGNITFTLPGIYYLSASVTPNSLPDALSNDVCLWVFKNDINVGVTCARTARPTPMLLAGGTASISEIYQVAAGDVFQLRVSSASNSVVNPHIYNLTASFYKMSN